MMPVGGCSGSLKCQAAAFKPWWEGAGRGGRVVRVRGGVSGIVVLILSLNSTGEHSTGARECV